MQKFKVDLQHPGIPLIVNAKQGDTARSVEVDLYDGGQAYEPPESTIASVWYKSAAGEGNYSEHVSIAGNTVSILLAAQMLQNAGNGVMCLVLHDVGGQQIGLWNFELHIEGIPGLGSAVVSEWFTALSEKVAAVAQSAAHAAASAVAAAESESNAAESAELAAQKAESIVTAGYMTKTEYAGSTPGTVKDAEKLGGKAPSEYLAAGGTAQNSLQLGGKLPGELGVNMDLLWQNPAPSQVFGAAKVDLDLTAYSKVACVAILATSSVNSTPCVVCGKNEAAILSATGGSVNAAEGSLTVLQRGFVADDTGVTFGLGYSCPSGGEWASQGWAAIPYKIYGIR